MKQGTGVFKQREETINVCDNCGKVLELGHWIVWDSTWYEYEETFGDEFEVCSIKCLREYLYNHRELDNLLFPSDGTQDVSISIGSEDAKKLYEILCHDYL